jgi:transcriptional regulator with XRE-family HTH domain
LTNPGREEFIIHTGIEYVLYKRTKLGLSKKEAAEKIGISDVYLGLIEKGKHQPGEDIIRKMAEVYNIEPEYLLVLFDQVPEPVLQELKESKNLLRALIEINEDNSICQKDKELLYQSLIRWHQKMKKDKDEKGETENR